MMIPTGFDPKESGTYHFLRGVNWGFVAPLLIWAVIGTILLALVGCDKPSEANTITMTEQVQARLEATEHEAIMQRVAMMARLEWELEISSQVSAVIDCESGGRHEGLWGDNHTAYGIAQFKRATFYYFAKLAGMKGAKWKNKEDQINLLRWAIEYGHGNNWTCFQRGTL